MDPQSSNPHCTEVNYCHMFSQRKRITFKEYSFLGASLVVQWLRICLSRQGTQVQSLVREDPTYCEGTKPMSHTY